MNRLGMESGAIADHQITAKNVLNNDYANYEPALARLNGISKYNTSFQEGYVTLFYASTHAITICLVVLMS